MPTAARDERMRQRLAAALPDAPRWLETRGMLLSGRGRLVGRGSDAEGHAVFDDSVVRLLSLVGRPAAAVVREALSLRPNAVLVQEEDDAGLRPLLVGFRREIAILHRLTDGIRLRPLAGGPPCRLLSAAATGWLDRWPEAQRREFGAALALGLPMAGALIGEEVAAVCYACYETGTLWDISIDTREEHRRCGLASSAVRFLAAHQAFRGLEPAWGAVETNRPSLTMAASLGFRPVERFVVYEPERSTWSGPRAARGDES